jgi:aryl-alcohol dehydrogenase-like predicted oxidoreductase
MEQRRLGTTGVWVSELCLGTMMFGEWATKDHDESIRIIHRALDAGITLNPADNGWVSPALDPTARRR